MSRFSSGRAVVVAALALTVGTLAPAQAVRMPEYMKGRPQLEVASGQPVREYRGIQWDKPGANTAAAWQRFTSLYSERWHAQFDAATGVPLRIFGVGIAAPGVIASDVAAEAYARSFLANHLDLLAPGAVAS